MWARGQAWAIYGYTMVYRETGEVRFLNFARKVADAYLSRLPEDLIPYWDFDAPDLSSGEPKDASVGGARLACPLAAGRYGDRPADHPGFSAAGAVPALGVDPHTGFLGEHRLLPGADHRRLPSGGGGGHGAGGPLRAVSPGGGAAGPRHAGHHQI